jgi:hypothetical protein
MAGPLGELVCATAGVYEGINVGEFVAVTNTMDVTVAICGVGVALATPITTGVGVKTEGVFVAGRKGVGGLNCPGWITQPLQDAMAGARSNNRSAGIVFFILFSS